MIFHIPTDTTLVSTDVAYQVPIYDANATYNDGDEVRQDDDNVYTVTNYEETACEEAFLDYKYYPIGSEVDIDGYVYVKDSSLNRVAGCWETLTRADGAAEGFEQEITFPDWDGVSPTFYIHAADTSSSCTSEIWGKAVLLNTTTYYKTYAIELDLNNSGSFTLIGQIDLYTEFAAVPNGCWKINELGTVSKYFGSTKSYVKVDGINNRIWRSKGKSCETKITKHKLYYIRPTVKKVPFDTKQYTTAKVNSSQSWVVKAPLTYLSVNREKVTSVMLGRVVGTNLHIDFLDFNGNTISSLDIDLTVNSIPFDMANYTNIEPSTHIIYIPQDVYLDVHQMSITISDNNLRDTEIGFISFSKYIDVGATNLEFTHDIKNFDKNKVSEISGYIDHIKGQRVVQHKGSFDIPLTDYDKMLMINKRFTQELIAIDGSDTTNNEASDSQNRFQSTKLIGRVKRLGMQTRTKQNKLDDTQTIAFEFEEVV